MRTTTRIEVSARPGEVPRVAIAQGALQARRLRDTGSTVRIALVAAEALLLAGDRVRVEVRVAGPVEVEIVETAGTVAHDMRGAHASWDVEIDLRDCATLHWDGKPFVVAAGADVVRWTRLLAQKGCRATLRETVVLGRVGEVGGALLSRTAVDHAGSPLLVEDLDLTPGGRSGWATLRGHRCIGSTVSAGYRLPDGPGVLQLDGPGSVHRWIGDHHHLAEAPRLPGEGQGPSRPAMR